MRKVCLIMAFALVGLSAKGQSVIDTGSTPSGHNWQLTSDSVLTFSQNWSNYSTTLSLDSANWDFWQCDKVKTILFNVDTSCNNIVGEYRVFYNLQTIDFGTSFDTINYQFRRGNNTMPLNVICRRYYPPLLSSNAFHPNDTLHVIVPCNRVSAYQSVWGSYIHPASTAFFEAEYYTYYDTNNSQPICQGTSYIWHHGNYSDYDTLTQAGVYYDTIINTQSCYVGYYKLTLYDALQDTTFLTDTVCQGGYYYSYQHDTMLNFGTVSTDTSGLYYGVRQYDNECHVYQLNLTVLPVPTPLVIFDTITCGSPYIANGFNLLGTYIIIDSTFLWSGIDTVTNDTVDYYNYIYGYDSVAQAGTYNRNIWSPYGGCDSTITLNLYVRPIDTTFIYDTIIVGEPYTEYGFNVSDTGVYQRVEQNINGCDSVIILNLAPIQITGQADTGGVTCYAPTGFDAYFWYPNYFNLPADQCYLIADTATALYESYSPMMNWFYVPWAWYNFYGPYYFCKMLVETLDGNKSYTVVYATVDIEDYLNGLNGTRAITNISIYPNPASKEINITSDNRIKSIELIDILGKVVSQTKEAIIDVSSFAKGNYFVKVYTDKGVMTKKFVLE